MNTTPFNLANKTAVITATVSNGTAQLMPLPHIHLPPTVANRTS